MGENKSFTELVSHIVDIYPKLKENKENFSEFVNKRFIESFMHDPQIKGEDEAKRNKADKLYESFMNAWEELYGDHGQQN